LRSSALLFWGREAAIPHNGGHGFTVESEKAVATVERGSNARHFDSSNGFANVLDLIKFLGNAVRMAVNAAKVDDKVGEQGHEVMRLVSLKHDDLDGTAAVLVVHANKLERSGSALALVGIDALPQVQQHTFSGIVDVLNDVRVTTEELAGGGKFFQAELAFC